MVLLLLSVSVCISNMDLPLWAHNCSELFMCVICNHFAVTAEKGPCVVLGLDGLSLCECECVFVYIYIYIV
jgi:hypothetical protein